MGDQLPVPDVPRDALWGIFSNISELQKADESLKETFRKVTEVDGEKTGVAAALTGEYYFIREGLLYHQPEGVAVSSWLSQRVLERRY